MIIRALCALTLALLAACNGKPHQSVAPKAAPPAAPPAAPGWTTIAARLGDWTFVTPLPQLAPLANSDGEPIPLRAAACAECHPEEVAEWRGSTHAGALHDLQYQAEIAKPDSPRWLCLNCHIPVQNQRRVRITPGTRLRDRGPDLREIEEIANPGFDAAMQKEAITCAVCHVRPDGAGRSVVLTPGPAEDAPHPVRTDAAALRSVCLRCHEPGRAKLTPTFFCWFETGTELGAGPFAGKKDCVDCHMPLDASGRHRHLWMGGGVPKSYDGFERLRSSGWRSALSLEVQAVKTNAGAIEVVVRYANERAGHWLPTADPERHLLLGVSLRAADGRELSRERLRIGQRWDWGDLATNRPAKRLADNRLRPGEARTWHVRLPHPPDAARVVVTALHVRLTPASATSMKRTDVSRNEALLPGVTAQVAQLPSHYPYFAWLHHETIALDGGARSRLTRDALIARSAAAGKLDAVARADLLAER